MLNENYSLEDAIKLNNELHRRVQHEESGIIASSKGQWESSAVNQARQETNMWHTYYRHAMERNSEIHLKYSKQALRTTEVVFAWWLTVTLLLTIAILQ